MTKRDFVLDSPPLSPDAIRDRFIETEGLSGSSYNDELIGTDDAKADTTNELTNINLIQNLDTFFSPDQPVHFNSGNIILGGGGSDRIVGGGGDDIIDGTPTSTSASRTARSSARSGTAGAPATSTPRSIPTSPPTTPSA